MKSLTDRLLKSSTAGLFAVCVTLLIFSGSSLASNDKQNDRAALAKMATIKIEEAIRIAKKKVSGTVTKAELESEHGPLMWEIEIVTQDGAIVEVHLNAKDGKLIDH